MSVRRYVASALVVLSLTLVTGCSGSSDFASEPAVGAGSGDSPAPPVSRDEGVKEGAPDQAPGNVEQARAVERTGSLTLEVAQPAEAAARLRTIAMAQGGTVASESIASLSGDDSWSSATSMVVLSVPTDKLAVTMDEVSKQGTVRNRTTTEQDLTLAVTDTESRIKTMRASVDRVRALLAEATSIGDVTAIESELTRREADLESLLAQRDILEKRTSMAQLSVSLLTPAQVVQQDRNPFMRGLSDGWQAFGDTVAGLLVGLGALLPFAVVAAVVAVPVLAWWRRRGPHRRPAAEAPVVVP